jgi:hypothetical protein
MSIFTNIFGGKKDSRIETISRRAFLRNVVHAAPAVVAVAAAIDLRFVPEIQSAARDALHKIDQMVEADLGLQNGLLSRPIQVQVPSQAFDPNARIWRSVANEAYAWADYVVAKTGVSRSAALRQTTRLAELIDRDLKTAGVTATTKIEVDIPVVTRTWETTSYRTGVTEKHCEIGLGVHKQKQYDGTDAQRVTFLDTAKKLVDHNGRSFERVSDLGPQVPAPKHDFSQYLSGRPTVTT